MIIARCHSADRTVTKYNYFLNMLELQGLHDIFCVLIFVQVENLPKIWEYFFVRAVGLRGFWGKKKPPGVGAKNSYA